MADSAYAWPSFSSPGGRDARAREEAAEQGYADGLARAQAELAGQREALARGIAALAEHVENLGEAQARAVTELALTVTRALLRAELRTNPAVLEALVREALAALEAGLEDVKVLVNPADYDALTATLSGLPEADGIPAPAPDPSVPEGGVSVSLAARSVEFDPLGRLESFVEQEVSDGAVGVPPDGSRPPV